MNFEEIVNISQGPLAVMNPVNPEKILKLCTLAGISEDSFVLDAGCGNGTVIASISAAFSARCSGIEIREEGYSNALLAIKDAGLEDLINIYLADASEYKPEPDEEYDLAIALGSSQIWGGIEETVSGLNSIIKEDGKVIIGERYWKCSSPSPEFSREWPEILTEYEILQICRENGYEIQAVIHSSESEWDDYESAIWGNCLRWLSDNPGHPDVDEVKSYFSRIQEEYLAYAREYIGWAMYLLTPAQRNEE
ncbi:class I SAM-dependent methyltransferase [Methanoplanus endosymbiosus]|uniref:Methyltransferase domain-containing protein n=1 Tax=Methanoplanus endosymbiosus TaxID=33865 RepID=A0A9E7PJY8_9EURY|nr:methyltransferase domain-containing protein [Methanoplanus endosymbiosus]UUX91278.1 methyltransferase domain-containing protein [Methanoplanus endosymbiosus]